MNPLRLVNVTTIFVAVISLSLFVSAKGALDDTDAKISKIESDISSLMGKLEQLRQDSSRAAMALSQSSQSSKIADVDASINRINSEIASLKEQRQKMKSDSLAQVAAGRERVAGLQRESASLQSKVVLANNELSLYQKKRTDLQNQSSGNDRASGFSADISRNDSLIVVKTNDIADLKRKRDKVRQDSLSAVQKLSETRMRYASDGQQLDGQIAANMAALQDMLSRQNQASQNSANVQTTEKQKLVTAMNQKTQVEGQISKAKNDLMVIINQRERIVQSSSAEQSKYEQQRKPLEAALASADAAYKAKQSDSDALGMLREKIKIDSAIAKTRNDMNDQIELSAAGNKKAQKMVEKKEDELTQLMSKLDDYIRNKPQVVQKDQQFAGMTVSQKKQAIDDQLASMSSDLATLKAKRDKAQQDLDAFEQKKPQASSSAGEVSKLDSDKAAKEHDVTVLNTRRDSLDRQIAASQNTLNGLANSSQSDGGKFDSESATLRKQKNDLLTKRMRLKSDSTSAESSVLSGLLNAKNESLRTGMQISALEKEIAGLNASSERLRQMGVDAQEKNRQAQALQQQDRRRVDSLISIREQDLAALSVQNDKINQSIQAATKEQEQTLRGFSGGYLDTQIAAKEQERASLVQSKNATMQEKASTDRAAMDKLQGIVRDMNATKTQINTSRSEINNLNAQRQAAADQAKRELAQIDNLITMANQENASLTAKRDKARQDSINFENAKGESMTRVLTKIRALDNTINTLQLQLSSLNDNLDKARQDSMMVTQKASGGNADIVAHLDEQITAKERELSDLRTQRQKAQQDAATEQRKNAETIMNAQREVSQRKNAVDQKKLEIAQQTNVKKQLEQENTPMQSDGKGTQSPASQEIVRYTTLIAQQQDKIMSLMSQRDAAAAKAASAGNYVPAPAPAPLPISSTPTAPVSTPSTYSPSSPAASKATVNSAETAQKYMETLYSYMEQSKISEAVDGFVDQQDNLQKYLSADMFQGLQVTLESISGTSLKGKKKKK